MCTSEHDWQVEMEGERPRYDVTSPRSLDRSSEQALSPTFPGYRFHWCAGPQQISHNTHEDLKAPSQNINDKDNVMFGVFSLCSGETTEPLATLHQKQTF